MDQTDSRPMKTPSLMPLIVFTGVYMAAMSVVAVRSGNHALPMYLVLLGIVIPVLFVVHRRRPVPGALLWCFSMWGLVHMAGGLMPIPPSWPRCCT